MFKYFLIIFMFATIPVFAQNTQSIEFANPLTTPTLTDLALKILNFFIAILSFVAVGAFLYAGLLFTTSGGDPQTVTQAKKIMIYTVIGGVILALSYSIPNIINEFLK